MRGKWKRNTVVVTMTVLVCTAVALNWKYSGEEALQKAQETMPPEQIIRLRSMAEPFLVILKTQQLTV